MSDQALVRFTRKRAENGTRDGWWIVGEILYFSLDLAKHFVDVGVAEYVRCAIAGPNRVEVVVDPAQSGHYEC